MEHDEQMDIYTATARLYSRLILLGWSESGAASFCDGIMHLNRTEKAREEAIAWACHDNDCLDIISTAVPKPEWDAVLFNANAAVMA
jgi:hypothetical protein